MFAALFGRRTLAAFAFTFRRGIALGRGLLLARRAAVVEFAGLKIVILARFALHPVERVLAGT